LKEGDEAMLPQRPQRFSSWRQVVAEELTQFHGEYGATDELLEAQLQRLESQCLQTLQARDRFYGALKAYVEQGNRSPDHQTLIEEWGATALKAYSQGSSYHLQRAIERMLKVWRQEGDRPVNIHSPQQPSQTRQQPKSLAQRLLGG
jgi:hypothetical protein